jgi:GDPmannose 4,6-dehydratase
LDEVGIESESGKVRIRVNPAFYRPVENENLRGSASKAKRVLGWEPEYTFEKLVEEMVLSDIELVKTGRIFANSHLDWMESDASNGSSAGEKILGVGGPRAQGVNGLDAVSVKYTEPLSA